jgi:hypothetical protein
MTIAKFLLAVFVISCTHYSQAADIRILRNNDGNMNKVIIEGDIVPGDYERFIQLIDANHEGDFYYGQISEVHIYSKGGSVAEAINIGTLIRELRLHTVAPSKPFGAIGASGSVCEGVKEQSNCTCLSACVLVFVGGINRFGNVLGVHRSYINHDVLKTMGGTEGINASTQLMEGVGIYLGRMGVPRTIIDRMNATSSQDISYLPDEEINLYLSGYLPQYSELVIAKCGDWKAAFAKFRILSKKMKNSRLSNQEQHEHDSLSKALSTTMPFCEANLNAMMRLEVFIDAMAKARSRVKRTIN